MPPRWGFSSSRVRGYNDVAPPELKNGSSAAASTAALIQQQCILSLSRRESTSPALEKLTDQ